MWSSRKAIYNYTCTYLPLILHSTNMYRVSQKKHSYKIFCRCSHGMRAVEHAIIAMCRTLCPHSPAHKILGNHSCVFSNFSNFVTSHESSGRKFYKSVFSGTPCTWQAASFQDYQDDPFYLASCRLSPCKKLTLASSRAEAGALMIMIMILRMT